MYATATSLHDIIAYFAGIYLTRTSVIFPNGNPSVAVPYTTKVAQKYMKDMMAEMESLTSYGWYFEAVPVYDSGNNLSSCPIAFKPFSNVVTQKYKAIQGTPRFLSADFNSDGNNVYTSLIQFGKTPAAVAPATEGVQYKGTSTNTAKVALYGLRTKTNTDTGLESNALCASFAQYALPKLYSPMVSGTVKLEGTIRAHIGDLVRVKVPGIDLYGNPVDGTYTVLKVHHSIAENNFTTTLSLGGSVDMDMEDYIIEFAKQNRLNLQNFVS